MAGARGYNWSREEVEATVAYYLRMLRLELAGQTYSKRAHNQALRNQLVDRSAGAIELKHANISAILIELGFVYISGYKPRGNYQQLLRQTVEELVQSDAGLEHAALQAVERGAVAPDLESLRGVLVEPPRATRLSDAGAKRNYLRRGVRRNYFELEARNRSLGMAGEQFVAEFEARRLHVAGHKALAARVEHRSLTQGDGLGYDVLSFDPTGRERFIEVKTTAFGVATPFYVSRNEVAFAEENSTQFVLTRVHEFRTSPRLYELKGSLRNTVILDPVSYIARPS